MRSRARTRPRRRSRSRARSGRPRRSGEESSRPVLRGAAYWAAARRPRCFERSIGERGGWHSRARRPTRWVDAYEHTFYPASMRVEYREEPCKTALNRVKGMPFAWSLNPYMGCVHRCTFCYVRAFEQRADRPSGEAYGVSIRVKVNVADVLRMELARKSWRGEPDRHRSRDRPVPAGRRPLPAHPRLPRGARRRRRTRSTSSLVAR